MATQNHKIVKITEQPFSCYVCDLSFSTRAHLKNHERVHHCIVHTEERPFVYDTCNMSFSQLGDLIYHTRINTGEKLYSCDICGKALKRP